MEDIVPPEKPACPDRATLTGKTKLSPRPAVTDAYMTRPGQTVLGPWRRAPEEPLDTPGLSTSPCFCSPQKKGCRYLQSRAHTSPPSPDFGPLLCQSPGPGLGQREDQWVVPCGVGLGKSRAGPGRCHLLPSSSASLPSIAAPGVPHSLS